MPSVYFMGVSKVTKNLYGDYVPSPLPDQMKFYHVKNLNDIEIIDGHINPETVVIQDVIYTHYRYKIDMKLYDIYSPSRPDVKEVMQFLINLRGYI